MMSWWLIKIDFLNEDLLKKISIKLFLIFEFQGQIFYCCNEFFFLLYILDHMHFKVISDYNKGTQ